MLSSHDDTFQCVLVELCGAGSSVNPALRTHWKGKGPPSGLLAHTRTHTHNMTAFVLDSMDSSIRSRFRAAKSLLTLVLLALVLYPGENALVEQQVCARGQDLLQAGFSNSVI